MNILFLMTLWTFAAAAVAGPTGREAWIAADHAGKIYLLGEYKVFFRELARVEALGALEARASRGWTEFLLSSAVATENLDCVYAGWPSRRVNNLCSSPARHNPEYQNGTCAGGELQCQPLLFGKNVCVPVRTRAERSSAFSNCDRKFQGSGRSAADVIAEVRADGKEAALLELVGAADRICREGAQAGTGMCRRLQAAVERVRAGAGDAPATPRRDQARPPGRTQARTRTTPPTAGATRPPRTDAPATARRTETSGPARGGATATPGTPVRRPGQTQEQLEQAVVVADQGLRQLNGTDDCEVEQAGTPIEREVPRSSFLDPSISRSSDGWDTMSSESAHGELPRGYLILNRGPNDVAREGQQREWNFISLDNARRETYLWVGDSPDNRVSNNLESVIVLVPRRVQPRVEALGNVVRVTLATGERIIFEKATGRVLRGVFRENRITHGSFNNVAYTGTGISIRVNKRGDDPRLNNGNATVTQNGRTCQVPSSELWTRNAEFRYGDDGQLVRFLNQRCGNRFSI